MKQLDIRQAEATDGQLPLEEVRRKSRDPIVAPAAAVFTQHFEQDKVELPSFLNFPSGMYILRKNIKNYDTL